MRTPSLPFMIRYNSLAVWLFLALALVLPSGFSVGALLLLLGSVSLLWQRPTLSLQRSDRYLIASLLLYFFIHVATNLLQRVPLSEYDTALRMLLVIPVLLSLRAWPPRPDHFWTGAVTGAIGAGGFAAWQVLGHGAVRAGGYTHPIQFGNISLLLGLFCLVGMAWARQQPHARRWQGILLIGGSAGLFGALLSSSRGSWLALPFAAWCAYRAYGRSFAARQLAIAGAVSTLLLASLFAIPRLDLAGRLGQVITEASDFYQHGESRTSIGARLEMWRGALVLIPEHPLLGWGTDGYMAEVAKRTASGELRPLDTPHSHVHNEYLDALVKRGLPGLLALLALYAVPLWLLGRHPGRQQSAAQSYALGGRLLIVSYAAFGLSQAFLNHNSGVMLLVFPLVMFWAMLQASTTPSATLP